MCIRDRGTLETRKLADFAVFSAAPLTAPNIAELDVVATIVGGALSYDSRAEPHRYSPRCDLTTPKERS